MDLILLVLFLCLIGYAVYLLTTKIPMLKEWATTIQILALVALLLYVASRLIDLSNVLPGR